MAPKVKDRRRGFGLCLGSIVVLLAETMLSDGDFLPTGRWPGKVVGLGLDADRERGVKECP